MIFFGGVRTQSLSVFCVNVFPVAHEANRITVAPQDF